MSVTRESLRRWFDEGRERGKGYMVIMCDTFDWSDYPVYCDAEDYEASCAHHVGAMGRIMEVYDLRMDRESQLKQYRAYHPPRGA